MTTKNNVPATAPATVVDTPALTLVQMTSGRVYLFGAPAEVAPATLGFFGAKPAALPAPEVITVPAALPAPTAEAKPAPQSKPAPTPATKPAAEKPAAEGRDQLLAELLSLSPQFGGMARTKNWSAATIRARIDAIRAGAPASTRGGKKPAAEKPAAEKPAAEKPAAEKPAPTPAQQSKPAPTSKPSGKGGKGGKTNKYPEAFHDLDCLSADKVLIWNKDRTRKLKAYAIGYEEFDYDWLREKNLANGVKEIHASWGVWIVQGWNADRKPGFLYGNKRLIPFCDLIGEFDWTMQHEKDFIYKG